MFSSPAMHQSLAFTFAFTLFITSIITSALPSNPIHPRGGLVIAHTCFKNQGSGNVCELQTNIDSCNTAVDGVCHYLTNFTVNTVHDTCQSIDIADCHAAICLPIGWKNYQYQQCVAGFQDIMADCIDPAGAGFSQHQQGGSKNVHFDDTSSGSLVDSKFPAWTIGAKKCIGGQGAATVVFSPTGGGAYTGP